MAKPRKTSWLFVSVPVVAIPAILVTLYVLSAGPVGWLVESGHLSEPIYERCYWPLYWTLDKLDPSYGWLEHVTEA